VGLRVKAEGVAAGAVESAAHLRERDKVWGQGGVDGSQPCGKVAACPVVAELAQLLLDVVREEG